MAKYEKLTDDLRAARAAAESADPGENMDGGSCNFDALALDLWRWREDKTRAAVESAGLSCYKSRGVFIVCIPCKGQAMRRTTMIEAAAKHMKAAGYNAYVRYMTD